MLDLKELERVVDYHNRKYWLENKPEISDEEFDILYRKLKELDPKNPVLHKFYFKPSGRTITHPSPMLSLEKLFTTEEVVEWVRKLKYRGVEYVTISPKYDGISGSLIYWGRNPLTGEVQVKLVTRGDGIKGEDITNRLPFIQVHMDEEKLISEGIQKGELIVKVPDFKNYMQEFSHPRNVVAGLLNPKREEAPDLLRFVEFIDYRTHCKEVPIDSFEEEFRSFLEYTEDLKETYPLDGVVVSVSERHPQIIEELGCTSSSYKYAIAYKFQSDVAVSELIGIEWNVSRAGRVVPTAIIQETFLEGANINRATLHNYEMFSNMNLSYLCLVRVSRAGMTVPQIVGTIPGTGSGELFEAPASCPCCGSKLEQDGVDLLCLNPLCREKRIRSVVHFVQTLDIKNVSEKTVEKMANFLGVDSFEFISIFQPLEVIERMGFGPRRSRIIHSSIWSVLDEKITIPQFLSALGIPKVSSQFESIMKHFNYDLNSFMSCEDFTSIPGIGKVINNILLRSKDYIKNQVDIFANIGLKFKEVSSPVTKPLSGMRFILTGKLRWPRKEVVKFIQQNGGEIVSGFKTATHIVAGDAPSPKKIKKAEQYGVSFLSGNDLFNFNF